MTNSASGWDQHTKDAMAKGNRLLAEQEERKTIFWGEAWARKNSPRGRAVFVLRQDFPDHTLWHVSSGMRSSDPANAHQHQLYRDAVAWCGALNKMGYQFRVVARLSWGKSDV